MQDFREDFSLRLVSNVDLLIQNSLVDKKNFGEVMTPLFLVEEMLNTLPLSVWKNKNLKWLDPCAGIGVFTCVIVYKLMNGLKDVISNSEDRYKHIMENMIYVSEIQQKNIDVYKKMFDPNNEFNLNIFIGDFLSEEFDTNLQTTWGRVFFDVTVMNSPYQKASEGDHNRSRPMYNLFIEKGIELSNKLISVHPTRWMGKSIGLDEFRSRMFSRKDLKLIKTFKSAKEIFGKEVELRGGIHYFLIDKEYDGLVDFDGELTSLSKFDIYVNPEFHSIVGKMIRKDNLSTICESNSVFMNFNHKELSDVECEGHIKCYVSKQKGEVKYIDKKRICNKGLKLIDNWKVFTPFAAGYGVRFDFFGNKIIGYPGEVCSNTFLTLLVKNKDEADSLISYMETKFCNFFLSLRKVSQNMNKKTLMWIPLVPFDRIWTNESLFDYFNINEQEKIIILK